MKKNRLTLGLFFGIIAILTLLVYYFPQTSFGRGIILSQVGNTLAEQGYNLSYQDSSGNLWRRLELTQTSLTTQGATLNFNTVGLNYNLLKLISGEKPLAINLKGVDGDLFLKQLLDREQTGSNIIARYLEDISIEEISLKLQDLPYDLPEFNVSNLNLLAFEPNNTHVRGELSTTEGMAELDVKIESTEPFKAKVNILKADAVLAQHWTQRVKAGEVSGEFDIDSGEVIGGLELTDTQVTMADIDITNIDGQFQLANNQITGQATGIAFDSEAKGDLQLDLAQQQWQSQITSTTDLSEASAWIFRKSPTVHDYLKLSGQAPIELNLSGWQDIELTGKAMAQEGLSMMEEPLRNVETDIYFSQGRTDVTVNADYRQGQMDYIRIAANQETLLKVRDMVFADADNQQASLNADVIFATGQMGLKRLDGPISIDYSFGADGQEEDFKVDIESNIKEDNWNFEVALADAYDNTAQGTVAMSSLNTTLALQSDGLNLNYLDDIFPNADISNLQAQNINLDLSIEGQSLSERLALNDVESIRNLLSQTKQLSFEGEEISFSSSGQAYSTNTLTTNIDLQNSKLSVASTGLKLPFNIVDSKLLEANLQTEGEAFALNVKADSSFVDLVEAKEISVTGKLNEASQLSVDELKIAALSAQGQIELAESLTLNSRTNLADVVSNARGLLSYSLGQTPITIDSLSPNPLQVSGTGTFQIGEQLQSQATLEVSGIDVFALPETLQADVNWQQDGALTIVDNTSGLSLNRKLVPVANSLGTLNLDSATNPADTIVVSEVVLANTPIELLGQGFVANGNVTLFPDSQPSIDAVLQTTDLNISDSLTSGYQVIAKGSLDALNLEVEVPTGTDFLNSGQLVTTQDLLFQGVLNVPAKQLSLSAPLGNTINTLSFDSQININELSFYAEWFETQDGSFDSLNVQLAQGGLRAITSLEDVQEIVVELSGQGEVDKLAKLFDYEVSGTLDIADVPVQLSLTQTREPEVFGNATFVGQLQGQALSVAMQGQGIKIVGDVKANLFGQEQSLSGEIYPSLALTTPVPYLGDVLLSGSPDALALSGQGVIDINQLLAELFEEGQLSDLTIEPQAWQLSSDLNSQKLDVQVGNSTGQFEWVSGADQDIPSQDFQWSLIANIDQQATWQAMLPELPVELSGLPVPLQLIGELQHSSEQVKERFQGNLIANTIPITVDGNREQLKFSSSTKISEVLSLGLLDADAIQLLAPVAEESVQAQGTIDIASGSYGIGGQVSDASPLGFTLSNASGLNSLSFDGATEVLGRVDWGQQWPVVGDWVGSSLATASTISLETEFQSNINEISDLTVSLDEGATVATIPFKDQSLLQIDSSIAWLKKLAEQQQAQDSQLPNQVSSILELTSALFSEQDAVQLQSDLQTQNLNLTIGTADAAVTIATPNLTSSILDFDLHISTERLQVWQSEGFFDYQTLVPTSILNYLISDSDLKLSGQYNRETQAFSSTLNNDYFTANIGADAALNSQEITFGFKVPASLLTQADIQSLIPASLQPIISQGNLTETVDVSGVYNLNTKNFEVDALLKHITGENTVAKIRSDVNSQIVLQVDSPAGIVANLLTQSVQLPSRLTTLLSQLTAQARLSAQGNYNLDTQSYNLDFELNQLNQESIPFTVSNTGSNTVLNTGSNLGDGVLNIEADLSSVRAIELIRQSGVLVSLPDSGQRFVEQFVNQNSNLIRLSGNYNQSAQTYVFNANMLQAEQLVAQLVVDGNAVDGMEVALNTASDVLGRLELTQLPLATGTSSLIQNYLQSPNTQAIQVKTKIANTAENIFDVTIDHPNLNSSKILLELNRGTVNTASMTAPSVIIQELVRTLSSGRNQNLDTILQQAIYNNSEEITLDLHVLEQGVYQLDILPSNIQVRIQGSNFSVSQSQSPLQVQFTLPSELLRQLLLTEPSLRAIGNSLDAVPLPETIVINGSFYPYNQLYQLSSTINANELGEGLVTELALSNLEGENQFKLSIPLSYISNDALTELGLPSALTSVMSQWKQSVHNVSTILDIEGFTSDVGFNVSGNINHNGYSASNFLLEQKTDISSFSIDTPSQPLVSLVITDLLNSQQVAGIESEIDDLLNRADRLKLVGELQRSSDDFDIDIVLSDLTLTSDSRRDVSANVGYKSGQFSLQSVLEQTIIHDYVPFQFHSYIPEFTNVNLNWQTPQVINISTQAIDSLGNNFLNLQGVLNNRTDFQFTTTLSSESLQSTKDMFSTMPVSSYLSLDQVSSAELSGNLNLQTEQYVVDGLVNNASSINIKGDRTRADFSGQLSRQLLNLSTIAGVERELADISYLPVQGNYDFRNGGYSLSTQLEGEKAVTASITNGQVSLQMEGLSVERIPVNNSEASWMANFENFDLVNLQTLDFVQNAIASYGIDTNLFNQTRLNGMIRKDASVSQDDMWQGEVLASTGRQDVSDIRIVGQAESLYVQTTLLQAGQKLDVSGPVYPNFGLQVQGDYVDASGVARATLIAQVTDWQQPVLNGVLSTSTLERGDFSIPVQEATFQASIADFQNWQETLQARIIASDNELLYQANTLSGNWALPVFYAGDTYTVTLKAKSNPINPEQLQAIQVRDLNLQADIVGDLFRSSLSNIDLNQDSLLTASVVLEPQTEAFALAPINSFSSNSITDVVGELSYNLNTNRLEADASLKAFNQIAMLSVVNDLGQSSAVVNFPSFLPSAVPELSALSTPTNLVKYFDLNEAVDLGLTIDGTGIHFISTGPSLVLNGQVSNGFVDVSAQHLDGSMKLSGLTSEALQLTLDIPQATKVFAIDAGRLEQLNSVIDVSEYLQSQLLFDGTVDLQQGLSIEGTARSADKNIQIKYVSQTASDAINLNLSTQINNKLTTLSATKLANTVQANSGAGNEFWQVGLDYGELQISGTVENHVDKLAWQLQSPKVVLDNLPLALAVDLIGHMEKTAWQPVGTWSASGSVDDLILNLTGDYRGDAINWQANGIASTKRFTDSLDSLLTFTGQGSCMALVCSLTQSQLQAEGVTANLAGTLSPLLDLNGTVQHPLLQTLDTDQSANVRLIQQGNLGYKVAIVYQGLSLDINLGQQGILQSVIAEGELSYQDALANQFQIETQDLSWTLLDGIRGTANGFINQRIGTSHLTSNFSIRPIQHGLDGSDGLGSLDITGPIYLNQQAVATGVVRADFNSKSIFDLSGYFDVNAPFQLLNANSPTSLGNLVTRLAIVKDVNSQSLLPYQLVGNIDSLAGIQTMGSLVLDAQTGAKLEVETVGLQGIRVSAVANGTAWQLDADVDSLSLSKEVLALTSLPQSEVDTITNVLSEFKNDAIIDADFSLRQLWQQELEVKENQLEVQVGSSRLTAQLELSDTPILTGQLDLNGEDLIRPLPISLSGPIHIDASRQINITNTLQLKNNLVEALSLSGSIWPPALYVQSPQATDYLYINQNQDQDIEISGNLDLDLKSIPNTFVTVSSTNEQNRQELKTSLLWQGLMIETVLPTTLSKLTTLKTNDINFELSGFIDLEKNNPIMGEFKIDEAGIGVDVLNIIDEFGTLNLSGSVDLNPKTIVDGITNPNFSTEGFFKSLNGELVGFIEPNWLRVSEQVTLPDGFSNTFSTLPLSAAFQDAHLTISSTSNLGTIALHTNSDITNLSIDTALNYNGLSVNGRASSLNSQLSGNFDYSGLDLRYAGETIGISGTASLLPAGLKASGLLQSLGQSANYSADIGWQALAKRLEQQLSTDIIEQLLKRLPLATQQEDIRIDIVDFSAKAIKPLQRVLPYFSPEVDGTITIQSGVLVGQFSSDLLTEQRQLPVAIRLDGLVEGTVLSEASVSLTIDESPSKATIDLSLQDRVLNGRVALEYFPLQTLLGIVPQESQAFDSLQIFEPFTASSEGINKLDLRVTGTGSAYLPLDQLRQSQVLLVAEQVIFDHESFVREAGIVMPEALRTQGQLTLRYQQENLNIEQAQFQSYRQSDQALAGNWSASGQISEDRLSVNLSAQSADLSPFILLSPALAEQDILAKGNFNISAQGSLREPVLFFSSNQFQADIGGGYVESEDVSIIIENGSANGRARLSVARPWQSDIEAEINGPVQLWPFDIDNVGIDFRSPAFSTNFFGDFKSISGRIDQQNGRWLLNAIGDLDNPFQITGTLNPLALQFSGDQLNLYSESFFVASSLSDIDLNLSYEAPNLVLRGALVASQAELITRDAVRARSSDNPEFFKRILFDNVLLRAPRNMVFSEPFLTAELATELYLAGSLAQPTLDGEAELLEGQLRYSGQSFTLTNGLVRFDKLQGIYPTLSASAFANLEKTRLSSNPESYVIQPNTNQFQIFLDANGGYNYSLTEGRYLLDLDAIFTSNAIVNPSSPRSLTEEDIVSLLTLKRVTTDGTSASDNVFGEIVGVNVVDAAADIIEGAIGTALGDGVDIFTTGLSNIIADSSNPNTTDPFGFGVRFSGYLDESTFASYEFGSFTNSNYNLRNRFDLRYDDIFGLNRLGINLSSSLDFANDSSDPLIEFNMGWDYEINETISLSNSMELSNDDQELSFGIRFKW